MKNIWKNRVAFIAAIAAIVTFALLMTTLAGVPLSWGIGALIDNIGGEEPVENSDGGNKNPSSKPTGGQVTVNTKFLYSADGDTKDISSDDAIKSGAMVLVDTTDGRVVAGKSMDTRIYPASMTKVMTLLLGCEHAKKDDALLTITEEMVAKYNQPENKGASVAKTWAAGEQLRVIDVLNLIIYESDTYACWLIAEHVAGSEEAFVELMNKKAQSMGLTNTHFTNSTGLFNTNHYTTCREMAAIMAAAMANEKAKTVLTNSQQYMVEVYKNGKKDEDASIAVWSGWYTGRLEKYRWGAAGAPWAGNGSDIKIISGKTGYEDIPTSCFVTAATDTETGRNYVCVQVGRIDSNQEKVTSKISTDDTRLMYQKYAIEKEETE